MNPVTQYPAAPASQAQAWFHQKLQFETDCADVHSALSQEDDPGFVLLHVVGGEAQFARRHIPGAVHLPHRDIRPEVMARWPEGTLFVVYCAGPHCNGADQAAMKLAALGHPVKLMIGGLTGWADEGFAFAPTPGSAEHE